jgi:hypothetical protein
MHVYVLYHLAGNMLFIVLMVYLDSLIHNFSQSCGFLSMWWQKVHLQRVTRDWEPKTCIRDFCAYLVWFHSTQKQDKITQFIQICCLEQHVLLISMCAECSINDSINFKQFLHTCTCNRARVNVYVCRYGIELLLIFMPLSFFWSACMYMYMHAYTCMLHIHACWW